MLSIQLLSVRFLFLHRFIAASVCSSYAIVDRRSAKHEFCDFIQSAKFVASRWNRCANLSAVTVLIADHRGLLKQVHLVWWISPCERCGPSTLRFAKATDYRFGCVHSQFRVVKHAFLEGWQSRACSICRDAIASQAA